MHYVPTAEGFGAAVRAGLGWGMYPERSAADALADGSFVRISDVHLDVPLYWQCWKLDSPTVDAVTAAVLTAATAMNSRPPPRRAAQSSQWWTVKSALRPSSTPKGLARIGALAK